MTKKEWLEKTNKEIEFLKTHISNLTQSFKENPHNISTLKHIHYNKGKLDCLQLLKMDLELFLPED